MYKHVIQEKCERGGVLLGVKTHTWPNNLSILLNCLTMYLSIVAHYTYNVRALLIAQRFSAHQDGLHAILRFLHPAEFEEGFALQIKYLLFGERRDW